MHRLRVYPGINCLVSWHILASIADSEYLTSFTESNVCTCLEFILASVA